MAEASSTAQQRWELENNVQQVDEVEGYFRYNQAEQQGIQQQRPWSKNPNHFKQYVNCVRSLTDTSNEALISLLYIAQCEDLGTCLAQDGNAREIRREP